MKQVVSLKEEVSNEKYNHKDLHEICPRLVVLEQLENGNVVCALNDHRDKQVEVERGDIEDIKPIMLVKGQDGSIHEVAGFYNDQGKIYLHTLGCINVLGGSFLSWGYANEVVGRMLLAREAGAVYCEVPKLELRYPYSQFSIDHLIHEQFEEKVALEMGNWKVVEYHDWAWRMQISEFVKKSNENLRIFQVRNVHGWGSLLTYEGNLDLFDKELFIQNAKELRERIDNRDQNLFRILSEDNFSMHIKKRGLFVETKL
ncbi:hypothetical protein ACFVS2_20905 [Brevibacillus sp. NPDC058079]|uniref:hypothetical protein n=1 Tax=Brevibacillus sp. NPDC058079 TaxID=3346330 RepID=UPI0036EDA128